MNGAPAGPYLASLRALNAGDLQQGGGRSSAAPCSWGWLQAARRLRGFALRAPTATEELLQLWPHLEVGYSCQVHQQAMGGLGARTHLV